MSAAARPCADPARGDEGSVLPPSVVRGAPITAHGSPSFTAGAPGRLLVTGGNAQLPIILEASLMEPLTESFFRGYGYHWDSSPFPLGDSPNAFQSCICAHLHPTIVRRKKGKAAILDFPSGSE